MARRLDTRWGEGYNRPWHSTGGGAGNSMKSLGFCAALALVASIATVAQNTSTKASMQASMQAPAPRPGQPVRAGTRSASAQPLPQSRPHRALVGTPGLRGLLLRVPRHRQARRPTSASRRLIGASSGSVGANWQDWERVAEMLESRRDAAATKPTRFPTDDERAAAAAWIRASLKAYEAAHAGEPGRVTVRRLTSAEYAYAIRDLTGIDIKVGIDASSDSVGGEGFANFGDVQFVQDASIERYLEAAKQVADHAVIGAGPLEFYADAGKTGLELSALEPHQRALRDEGLPRRLGRRRTPVRPRALRQGVLRRVVLQAPRRARRSGRDDSRTRGEGRHHRPLRRAHLDGRQQAEHRLSDARRRSTAGRSCRRRPPTSRRRSPRRAPAATSSTRR